MSFDIKYDRDGNPVKNVATQQQLDAVVEQPAIEPQEQSPVQEIEQVEEQVVSSPSPKESYSEPVETEQQYNFRQLKSAKEKAEREREEALRFAMDLQAKYAQQKQAPELQVEPEVDDIQVGEGDLVEGKDLRALSKKMKAQRAEFIEYKKQVEQQQGQLKMQATEAKIKSQYPDFDKIVSKENIAQLQEFYPEIAQTLNSSQDIYATAVSAYTMIKKLGIYKEDTYVAEKIRAQVNAAKPKAMNSIAPQTGDSPLAHANAFANGLTEQLKAKLLQEMRDVRRNN